MQRGAGILFGVALCAGSCAANLDGYSGATPAGTAGGTSSGTAGGGDGTSSGGESLPDAQSSTSSPDASAQMPDADTCGLPFAVEEACTLAAPQLASAVLPTCGSGAPPSATGGTILPGAYVLTAVTYYGVCPTLSVQAVTWYVCSRWVTVQGTGGQTLDIVADVAQQPTTLVPAVACPAGGVSLPTFAYTSTGSTLTLTFDDGGGTRVDSFTRITTADR